MNFSQQAADPRRHAIGLSVVVLLHVVVVYALLTGLAKKVVDIVKPPIDTRVIEEVVKPQPPPEVMTPPPPQVEAPPPPFVPPPDVLIQAPPPVQPTITATATPPPLAEFKPVPPAAVQMPPGPASVAAGVVCSNFASVMGEVAYPREAQRSGIEKGEAVVQFVVAASGEIKDAQVVRATHPIFGRAALRIVSDYKCQGRGRDVLVEVPIGFQLL